MGKFQRLAIVYIHISASYCLAYGVFIQAKLFGCIFVGETFSMQKSSERVSGINELFTVFHME